MPDWRSAVRARLTALRLAPEREAEIAEEVAQHLDDRYREMRAAGQDHETAAAAAWRELEEDEVLGRELRRSERPMLSELPPPGAPARGRWLRALWQDVRYSVRTLRQQPTFTATVVLALALAIGPATAILSLGNWLLWRPLPGATDAGRLALVEFFRQSGTNQIGWGLSHPNRLDMKARMTAAAGLEGVQEVNASLIVGDAPPRMIQLGEVTHAFFDVLGVPLSAGRAFRPEDDRGPAGAPVAIVGHGLAQRAFGSPGAAIGQRLLLNRQPFQVIGVAGPGFTGVTSTSRVDAWITVATMAYLGGSESPDWAVTRARGMLSRHVTRMAPGRTPEAVAVELTLLAGQLVEAYPEDNGRHRGVAARVTPRLNVPSNARARMESMVNVLLAIGGVLLLLGCANAANMLIARAVRREQEIAVRKALGASRLRLVQVQVTESCLLALGGAVAGLGLALVLKQVMQQWLFPAAPAWLVAIPIDQRVLAMTVAAALAVGVIAGVAPAWLVARGRAAGTISRSGPRAASRAPRLRTGLAVVQLALSLALLIGAALLVTTLRNLRGVDLGFDPASITTLRVNMDDNGYTLERAAPFLRELLNAVAAGGAGAATVAERAPFSSSFIVRVLPPGAEAGQALRVWSNGVADNYFAVLGTPIVHGRAFTPDEAFSTGPLDRGPVILNETLARQLFGTPDATGRIVEVPAIASQPARHLSVVGVARDSHWVNITGDPEPFLYQPLGQYSGGLFRATIIVRSPRPPRAVADDVQAISARIDRMLAWSEPFTLEAEIASDTREQRLFGGMLSWLSVIAFVLAAVGLHGLVAQTTTERTREFGIRLAIGARRADIVRLVARYVAAIAILGTAAGVGLAVLGTPLVRSMLFGVEPLDPAIYALAAGLLVVVIGLAAAWPTWRATRVQPVEVLRAE